MKINIPILVGVLVLTIASFARADEPIKLWHGVFRDVAGKPLADLEMHCWRANGSVWEHRITRTNSVGLWSIELSVGNWRIAARPDELLARGYFCEPGSFIGSPWGCETVNVDPATGIFQVVPCSPTAQPPQEILWGPGIIEWTPAPENGAIVLTAIPTRPTLTVIKSAFEPATIELNFETQSALPMLVTRRWRVEKSTDLQIWRPVQTVALGQFSPILVLDADSLGQAVCYYRAAIVEDLIATP